MSGAVIIYGDPHGNWRPLLMRPRVHHRALPDAESLWRTWRAIGDESAIRAATEASR